MFVPICMLEWFLLTCKDKQSLKTNASKWQEVCLKGSSYMHLVSLVSREFLRQKKSQVLSDPQENSGLPSSSSSPSFLFLVWTQRLY